MGNLNDREFKREGIDLRSLPARWKAAGMVILAGGTLTLLFMWANSAELFGLRIPGVYLLYAMFVWQFAFIGLGVAVLVRHLRLHPGALSATETVLCICVGLAFPMAMILFD